MTPRAVRPARARTCAAGLREARLALRFTPVTDAECIPVSTTAARPETSGTPGVSREEGKGSGGHGVRLRPVGRGPGALAGGESPGMRRPGLQPLRVVRPAPRQPLEGVGQPLLGLRD